MNKGALIIFPELV